MPAAADPPRRNPRRVQAIIKICMPSLGCKESLNLLVVTGTAPPGLQLQSPRACSLT